MLPLTLPSRTTTNLDCQRLLQLYAVHKTIREARKKGYTAQRQQLKDGSVKLVLLATGGAT